MLLISASSLRFSSIGMHVINNIPTNIYFFKLTTETLEKGVKCVQS